MSIASIARPEIQRLQPYTAAEQLDDTIRLNANEAPLPASRDSFRRPLNRYPEIRPQRLVQALARRFEVATDELLVTRGSSEAIDLLLRTFCRAGLDNIVCTAPSFSMYRHYADIQGAEVRAVASDPQNDFAVDVDALMAACDDNSRLLFLCSPNNPTGTLVHRDSLRQILTERCNRSAVVLDEAYIEFADGGSCSDLLAEFDNLIVLRTLSKALAFAGARCGVVLARRDVIRMLDAVQPPYALATPVVECIEDALQQDALDEAERRVRDIIAERERVVAALESLPFVQNIWPSAANFILIRVSNAADILEQTRRDRILLRYYGGELADCIRITIGSNDENDRLLQSLGALLEETQ